MVVVDVAGLQIRQPRIRVEIDRQIDHTQDKGVCTIYNLQPSHEQQIQDRGGAITIQAGYPQTIATLYDGTVQRVRRPREGLARLTRIDLGDAVHSADRLSGIHCASYRGHVLVTEIVRRIIRQMGLVAGPLDAIPPPATYKDWYWGGASAASALDVILRTVSCTWWNDDGVIRINRRGTVQSDISPVEITPENGLVGIPTITDEGAEARMFLNPAVRVGGVLSIRSESLAGTWKVVGLQHNADNWGGKFETFADLRDL